LIGFLKNVVISGFKPLNMKMDGHINRFPEQVKEALTIASRALLNKKNNIHHVLVTGLGGSGIGGSIVNELVQENCSLPILVNKDYFLPSFVNENTLVVVSSYSGNTEETLNCLIQAIEQKAQIVCITSGGKVEAIASEHGLDIIKVPGGNPPRTCLGYSIVQLLKVLHFNGFISLNYTKLVEDAMHLLEINKESIKNEALKIAEQLQDKLPVIYSLGNTESIAVRFRQQINENSKMLCWHHVIPEMNHNELVGWRNEDSKLSVIVLRTKFDYPKNIQRLAICKDIFLKYTPNYIEIHAKGDNRFEETFYLIHLTDWVSYYLAEINKVDAIEVNVIDYLKNSLTLNQVNS